MSENFGKRNFRVAIDEHGIMTIRIDTKHVIAQEGMVKSDGKSIRKNDLVSSTQGWLLFDDFRISMNVVKA